MRHHGNYRPSPAEQESLCRPLSNKTQEQQEAARYRELRDHWDEWTGKTWSRDIPRQLDAALDKSIRARKEKPATMENDTN